MFFLPKSQLLGVLGALTFGSQAVQGIELDLSDTSKILPTPECPGQIHRMDFLFSDR